MMEIPVAFTIPVPLMAACFPLKVFQLVLLKNLLAAVTTCEIENAPVVLLKLKGSVSESAVKAIPLLPVATVDQACVKVVPIFTLKALSVVLKISNPFTGKGIHFAV